MTDKALLSEYYIDMLEHIKASSDVQGQLIEHEYLDYILNLLSDSGEFDDYVIIEDGRDGAGRWLIDGYSYDENNFSLSLFVTILSTESDPNKLTRKESEIAIKKLGCFLKICLSGVFKTLLEPTSTSFQAAEFIYASWESTSRVNLLVISNRESVELRKDIEHSDIDSHPCAIHIWDLKRIYELESSRTEREEMFIDLTANPVPCLLANKTGNEVQSLLAVVSGSTLVDLYGKWGSRLLEQNVRSFLQTRGKVNKGIRTTLMEDPDKFFPYNNGLTTVAEEVTVEVIDGHAYITGLKNLQIVNGGQTTASIYSTFFKDKADVSDVFVQMKLTVLPDFETSDLVSKIARFANSQNKVSDADLFSNHPFHVRIEEFSRRIWVPIRSEQNFQTHWFYERARGQFLDAQAYMSQAERRKFIKLHPRHQLLTKTDVAKITNSWEMLPHEVSKGAQKNFSKFAALVDQNWEKDDLQFNEYYFRKLVSRAYIFRKLEKDVLKAPWYSGYRANIVTYAIARFALEIKNKGSELNYDILWRSPNVPDVLMSILMDLSGKVNDELHDESRPIGNISEYAKRAGCWDKIQQMTCDISEAKMLLIDKSEAKAAENDSKDIQTVDNSIKTQEIVITTPKDTWEKIETLLLLDDAATPSLIGILKTAKSALRLPSEKQSKVLVKLLNKYSDRLN